MSTCACSGCCGRGRPRDERGAVCRKIGLLPGPRRLLRSRPQEEKTGKQRPGRSPMRRLVTGLAAVIAAGSALAAYPDRPVKLIVPWAAGGDTDAIFRPFARSCRSTSETVVVANVDGRVGHGRSPGGQGLAARRLHPLRGPRLHPLDLLHRAWPTSPTRTSSRSARCRNTPSVLTASPKTKWTSGRSS